MKENKAKSPATMDFSSQNFTNELQTSYLSGASRYRLMRLSQVQKSRKCDQDNEEKSQSPRYRCNYETRNPVKLQIDSEEP